MTKSFIQHNCACQKDKGTDYARAVLDEFLHRHYRKYGRAGGVLQVDVHGYYPNMKHQVAKDKFKKHLEPDIYKRAEAVLEDQYEGDVGYNPGSQMIQIAGISVLDELDHFIKEQLGIKRYLRYMDDFLLIHEDLEYLEYCKDKVIEKLAEYGFEPNPKKTKSDTDNRRNPLPWFLLQADRDREDNHETESGKCEAGTQEIIQASG